MSRIARYGIVIAVLAAVALPAAAQQAMAIVDVEYLMLNSDRGKEIQQQLKTEFAAQVAEMRSRDEALTALGSRIASQSSTLSVEAIEKLRREFEDSQLQLQRLNQDVQSAVQKKQGELFGELEKDMIEVIEVIRSEKGLDLVFAKQNSGIIGADPALDITAEVIRHLNTTP